MNISGFILLLNLFILICFLSGCSNEKKGVPESIVLHDVAEVLENIEVDYQLKIEHSVDTSSHIDNATIILKYETDYTKQIGMVNCRYQYDKSSDIWTLLEIEEWTWETELKESFTEIQPYMGSSIYETYNYALYIDVIDIENMTITCSYIVNIDGEPISQVEPVEFQLRYVQEWRCYIFMIDDIATFKLGDNGITCW